jgi:predicted GIY-YIG superfamily endonuclease
MPKSKINYDNTYFYKIICKDINIKDIYVGHTTNFIKRKNQHKSTALANEYSKNPNRKLPIYLFIRANG